MEGVGVVAVGDELVGDLLGVAARTAEDDGVDVGVVVGYAFESQIFVFGIDHVVDVADVLGALVTGANHHLLRLVHEPAGYVLDLTRHGGAEQQHAALLGDMA